METFGKAMAFVSWLKRLTKKYPKGRKLSSPARGPQIL